MTNADSNIEYVANVLRKADKPFSASPLIYCLWGCIVLIGSGIAEFWVTYTTTYWLIVAPIGFLLSGWIGARASKALGQNDKELGIQSFNHFLIMLVFVFTAIFTKQYSIIFLLVGLTYCLAGIYSDKIMLWIGGLYWLIYLSIYLGFLTSSLVVGIALALAFFISAWASIINNRLASAA